MYQNFSFIEGSVSKLNQPIQSSVVGAGFACPKTQSKLFSGERTSPLRTKRQHYPRFDTPPGIFIFLMLNFLEVITHVYAELQWFAPLFKTSFHTFKIERGIIFIGEVASPKVYL